MSYRPYTRIDCDVSDATELGDPAFNRLLGVLLESAQSFAAHCRANPRHDRDPARTGQLLCAVGLGEDETHGFLRALDQGLVVLDNKGGFQIPAARACSPNLHLVGREGDGVKLHNEVLIHVSAYAELILDHGWNPDRLVFDPFFTDDHLDLWGYAEAPRGADWRDGDVVFAAEAKSRVKGADGLQALRRTFDRLAEDPEELVPDGHRHKWNEIVRLTRDHPIELLLVADSARWRYVASANGPSVNLR